MGLHHSPRGAAPEPAWARQGQTGGTGHPSPTPSTERLSLGRPHQRGAAFPASDPPQGSVGFTLGSPSDPLSRGYLVSPRLLRTGEAPRLTSNWKSGTASASRGGLSGIHTPGPVHRDPRHSPPPGSGRRHCDVTPDSGKGTAHLPCSPIIPLPTTAGVHSNNSVYIPQRMHQITAFIVTCKRRLRSPGRQLRKTKALTSDAPTPPGARPPATGTPETRSPGRPGRGAGHPATLTSPTPAVPAKVAPSLHV